MSSTSAYHSVASTPQSFLSGFGGFSEEHHKKVEDIKSWHSLVQESRFGSSFASGLPTPPEPRAMTGVSLNQHNLNDVARQNYYPSKYSNPGHTYTRSQEVRHDQTKAEGFHHSRASSRDQTQFWSASREKEASQVVMKEVSGTDSTIASYLQIPASINDSKGSLAEFAAEITCLFWFELATTLQYAEEPRFLNGNMIKPLGSDTLPTMGFLKWVTTILSTTQVTQNVILLALLFIHRLKKFNPGVSGKKGSEYRLLTIALMLGNKFLDDNTYTNKTWAEVSGISVSEIHVMEVEFLSNMRYNLYVSEEEWKRWHVRLARFSIYFTKASKARVSEVAKSALPVTPVTQMFPYKLPSPPSPARLGPALPMYQPSLPNPIHVVPYLPHSQPRLQLGSDQSAGSRKRSLDFSADMPVPKRLMFTSSFGQSQTDLSPAGTLGAYTPSSSTSNTTSAEFARDIPPIPKLPVPYVLSSANQLPRQHSSLSSLAVPSVRAMASVYPTISNNWTQPVTPVAGMSATGMGLYANPTPTLAELSRSQYASANVSPSATGYGTITPTRQLSPSYFLSDRNSPYRPVRSVNTLLIPPPSSSLHNPPRNIGVDQIRYHALGKAPTESRAGIVPYTHRDAWPQPWTAASGTPTQYTFQT